MTDSEQSTNFAEYSYEKAITPKDKMHRFLYVAGVVLFMMLPVLIAVIFHIYFLIYIMPLFLILGVPLAKFLYRYLQNEFKYTVDRSNFKMEIIHGKAKPKLLYETDVKDMDFAKPASSDIDRSAYDTVVYCCVSDVSPDLYVTSFTDKKGKKVLLYFEGSKKALKIMNYYNKNVVVNNDLKH
ncbi:MAG: hypothetical protein IJT49_08730 [Clostridia bacterium]|nr:hypothetical protein [Clostridia bacterium]